MDSKTFKEDFLVSLFLVIRRSIQLIVSPYRTMRKISQETDFLQILIIFFFIFVYFLFVALIRNSPIHSIVNMGIFLFQFGVTVLFFYGIGVMASKKGNFYSYLFTLSYTMLPTFVWFTVNTTLFLVFPPHGTLSFFGKGFNMLFLSFSLSIFFWKILLVYLAIRFSSGWSFFRILYVFLLYLIVLFFYWYLSLYFKLFLVPFL
ncbi:hypothetical protein COT62_01085 [Candidatus Roizmanbacteria bacterium CG09_land_8_20_14_0_10_41_9]|uniref:Yip1 domain-containing protein n=1 Tax=Candidatus Roizmanbacteria bacterium CG09_land_8_20_14_0_10_41_9 TaxID=1974850 RepID=A0A2H0WVI4_9BACT|nr:MAG: hypothetical protein COT62_01085 [Candidatus Roizmanbacteria bacterium CG09_land_8_20_14_0_10_41_9]